MQSVKDSLLDAVPHIAGRGSEDFVCGRGWHED
jgi:hypothetical protein